MHRTTGLPVLLCLLVATLSALSAAEPAAGRRRPTVWMIPPPWAEGACLKELVNHDGQWPEARSKIDGLGYYCWLLHHQFSDAELKAVFAKLKQWDLQFAFEIPVVKGADWGFKEPLNAQTAFARYQEREKRFSACGMAKVTAFAFDEPIYAARHMIPHQITQRILPEGNGLPNPILSGKERMQYGITETVSFIGMMRRAYPDSRLGDIEPYPVLTYDEIVYALDSLQSECAKQGLKGLDFFRVDVDWASMIKTGTGSWLELKKIETYCRSKGIAFGMIYWAPAHEFLKPKGIDYDLAWYTGLMHHGSAYALVDGDPDECVLESWMHIPAHAVPETDMTSFTRSVLDFCRAFVPERRK